MFLVLTFFSFGNFEAQVLTGEFYKVLARSVVGGWKKEDLVLAWHQKRREPESSNLQAPRS